MKGREFFIFLGLVCFLFSFSPLSQAAPLGTAFTYQGRLTDGSGPANGTYDFEFRLYDAQSGGAQVGSILTQNDIPVTQGLFTVVLDFGTGRFIGDALWLEIGVRPGNSGGFTPLTPRQALTSMPYALYAPSSGTAGSIPWANVTGMPAGFADGIDNDTQYSAGTGLTLSGTQFSLLTTYQLPQTGCSYGFVPKWNTWGWSCLADNDTSYTVGTGLERAGTQFSIRTSFQMPQGCTFGSVPKWNSETNLWFCAPDNNTTSFWGLTGNSGTTPGTNYIGTADNAALEFKVNNARRLRIEPSNNIIGGYHHNDVTSGVIGATIGGGGASSDMYSPNRVYDNLGTVGGGSGNSAGDGEGTTEDRESATVGGGWKNAASGSYSTIGGGGLNNASANASFVGGGFMNRVTDSYSTIGGGGNNQAGDDAGTSEDRPYATVSGGEGNKATGSHSAIVGGNANIASGLESCVGGGYSNEVSSARATVGGGYNNEASGNAATVPGGADNLASGGYSFAAGNRAKAADQGSFVWSSGLVDTFSWGDNTFSARSPGGVRFYSSTIGVGVQLSAGGSSWGVISDRNQKENIGEVNVRRILDTLSVLPVSNWNLKAQPREKRHIGPMAQDFNGSFEYLFGELESPVHINTMDAIGVSMAAIQGLYQVVQEKETRIEAQQTQINNLQEQISRLEESVRILKQAMAGDQGLVAQLTK